MQRVTCGSLQGWVHNSVPKASGTSALCVDEVRLQGLVAHALVRAVVELQDHERDEQHACIRMGEIR